jgi:thioredoxin-related protein
MRANHFWAAALIILVFAAPVRAAEKETVKWRSFESAVSESAARKIPAMIYFFSPSCRACAMMDQNVFSREQVAEYINLNFVPVRVNVAERRDLKRRFRITSYPRTFFIDESGKQIDEVPGYIQPKKFLVILRYFGEGAYARMRFDQFEQLAE